MERAGYRVYVYSLVALQMFHCNAQPDYNATGQGTGPTRVRG